MITYFDPENPVFGGDLLMAWARQQAPPCDMVPCYESRSPHGRRVRLEISAEPRYANYPERNLSPDAAKLENVIARVYLAEPLCIDNHLFDTTDSGYIPCECDPLAERRIG
jgi:hypothetical protein